MVPPMARIPYPEPSQLSDETRELMAKLPKLNIFRMLSHSGNLLRPFVRLGNAFLAKGALDPVLREIAILRVGYLSNARYETHQHERIGKGIGMDEKLFAALRSGDASALTPDQALVLRYVDELVQHVRASDATFAAVRERFSVQQLQELTLVTGYYMMVCRFLETFGVEIESSAR